MANKVKRFKIWHVSRFSDGNDMEEFLIKTVGLDGWKIDTFEYSGDEPAFALIKFTDCDDQLVNKLLTENHVPGEKTLFVLPEAFETVSATISTQWLEMLCDKRVDSESLLSEICKKQNVALDKNHKHEFVLTGNIDEITRVKEILHMQEKDIFMRNCQSQTGPVNAQSIAGPIGATVSGPTRPNGRALANSKGPDAVGSGGTTQGQTGNAASTTKQSTDAGNQNPSGPGSLVASSTPKSSERSQSPDGSGPSSLQFMNKDQKKVRALKKEGDNKLAVPADRPQKQRTGSLDDLDDTVAAAAANSNSASAAAAAAGGAAGAARRRQLKDNPASASSHQGQPSAPKSPPIDHPASNQAPHFGSIDSSFVGRIVIRKVKAQYVKEHFNKEYYDICDKLLSINPVNDPVDGHSWVFRALDKKQLDKAEGYLSHLVSIVLTENVDIPAGMALDTVASLCFTNRNQNVALDLDGKNGVCYIYGKNDEDVKRTKRWLEDTLFDNQSTLDGPSSQQQVDHGSTHSSQVTKVSTARSSRDQSSKSQPANSGKSADFTITSSGANQLDFRMPCGVEVHVHEGDMLRQQTEVIVNSANDQLAHGAGLARAILTAGGPEIDKESRDIIKTRGALKMGDVVHTTAGKLNPPVRYVIHAVPPSGHQMNTGDKKECDKALRQVFYGSMVYTNDQLHCASLTLPPFGAGIFAVPVNVIMQAAFDALKAFDKYLQPKSLSDVSLRDIHFVSNDPKLAAEMISAFKNMIQPSGPGTAV